MFQPSLNYSQIYWDAATGVYGFFNNNRSGLRSYFHNETLPLIFNQDIVLKNLIDGLTNQLSNLTLIVNAALNTTSNTIIYQTNETHPLTYFCWVWTLLTIFFVLGIGIHKVWSSKKSETI